MNHHHMHSYTPIHYLPTAFWWVALALAVIMALWLWLTYRLHRKQASPPQVQVPDEFDAAVDELTVALAHHRQVYRHFMQMPYDWAKDGA